MTEEELREEEQWPPDPRRHFDKKDLCQRCLTGIDNNHDGDCMFCHKLEDFEAKNMKRIVLLAAMMEAGGGIGWG